MRWLLQSPRPASLRRCWSLSCRLTSPIAAFAQQVLPK